MTTIEHISPPGLAANPAYTHVVAARANRTVYISGQVAMDAAGESVGVGDLAAQTEQVMRNLGAALAAAGAGFDDVVKITTYVVGYEPEQRAVIGEVRGRHLPAGNPPASTLVGVSALAHPDWLIEIEAVAVTD
ncbi:MAG: RidA family protein [Acidimicrobiales bacterium]